ncbi:MAG: hypothetical protein KDD53_06580 [Bdellovibrionales bacterium]|nr:hypothetical protein [Bdellovibrionales bacterium]
MRYRIEDRKLERGAGLFEVAIYFGVFLVPIIVAFMYSPLPDMVLGQTGIEEPQAYQSIVPAGYSGVQVLESGIMFPKLGSDLNALLDQKTSEISTLNPDLGNVCQYLVQVTYLAPAACNHAVAPQVKILGKNTDPYCSSYPGLPSQAQAFAQSLLQNDPDQTKCTLYVTLFVNYDTDEIEPVLGAIDPDYTS